VVNLSIVSSFRVGYDDVERSLAMNILDVKESKIKAYLKFLYSHGATSKTKAVRIDDVERGVRMDDRMFDEITRYVLAEGYAQRSIQREIYITKSGINQIKG
jgi:hypothetical protein